MTGSTIEHIYIYIYIFNLFLTTFQVDIHVSFTHFNVAICSTKKRTGVNESINKKNLLISHIIVIFSYHFDYLVS